MGETIALVVTGVLLCLTAVLCTGFICWHMYFLRKSLDLTHASIEALKKTMDQSQESVASAPTLLSGILKVAETQVESITSLESTITHFRASLIKGDGAGTTSDHEDEMDEYESEKLRLEDAGMPKAEVEARMRELRLYGGLGRLRG